MSFSNAVKETFEKEVSGKKTDDYNYKKLFQQRLIEYRKEPNSIVRIDKPTNIPRARELGYKAKKGFVVLRVRVRKGSGQHTRPKRARRPKRMAVTKLTRRISTKTMAEKRADKKYPNCEVLNSYVIGEDGKNKYFEVILVDVAAPEIQADKEINWICYKQHRGRAERGLTSSGKKSRGLRNKGKGAEKVRPSQHANDRKAK
jgi:large subunit ribosomal protein L15e